MLTRSISSKLQRKLSGELLWIEVATCCSDTGNTEASYATKLFRKTSSCSYYKTNDLYPSTLVGVANPIDKLANRLERGVNHSLVRWARDKTRDDRCRNSSSGSHSDSHYISTRQFSPYLLYVPGLKFIPSYRGLTRMRRIGGICSCKGLGLHLA